MNVVLLTTDTPHHLHYAREVHRRHPLAAIFLETTAAKAPFPTTHPFEAERDAHERRVLLRGWQGGFKDVADTRYAGSMNEPETVAALRALRPDVLLVFGTGRLAPDVIAPRSRAALNLHGGNPEEYRGLDTHLWAVYHADFANLVTTLHHIEADLDTGAVVASCRLPLRRGMGLHELRAVNTAACVDLSLDALDALARGEAVPGTPQAKRGRYYSHMPAVLKEMCVAKFARHTAALPEVPA